MTCPVPNEKQDRAQRTLFSSSDRWIRSDVVREMQNCSPRTHCFCCPQSTVITIWIMWGSSFGLRVCEHRLIRFKLILAELAQTDRPFSFQLYSCRPNHRLFNSSLQQFHELIVSSLRSLASVQTLHCGFYYYQNSI